MWSEMVWRGARWLGPEAAGAFAGCLVWWRMSVQAKLRIRESRLREEMQAYAELEVRLVGDGDVRELAGRVCRAMSARSAFRRTAMLVRDAEARLVVAASAGMEEETSQLLSAWAENVPDGSGVDVRRSDRGLGVRVGSGSFAVVLGAMPAEVGYARAVVIPLRSAGGRMLGALAVGADGLLDVRRSVLQEVLAPLEALAMKVARSLENAALVERLMRAEKLAGLGLLAGGMAHALNNPLTAVLGFAELIGGTTDDARVKEDATRIVGEALKMRGTLESLREFWRPAEVGERPVDVMELVRELAAACADQLEGRGVRLEVQAEDEPLVRGNRHRLRQLLEHLLNNAAQALAGAEGGEKGAIRVSVSHDAQTMRLLVSDTGPGFREPARVFDPFREETGAGLGLSVCYGIVHEHGGEIRAFNLQPRGAAVVVELPVMVIAKKNMPVAG